MKKIKLNYIWHKRISLILQFLIPTFIIFFVFAFFIIIYDGILSKDHTQLSYALFAANAIMCNCLLAFGRSPIFMFRFNDIEQKLIYHSATMFLYSTVISLFTSAYIFANTDKGFGGNSSIQETIIGKWIILISITIGLGVSIIFSVAGLIYFVQWTKKAIDKTHSETKDKLQNL